MYTITESVACVVCFIPIKEKKEITLGRILLNLPTLLVLLVVEFTFGYFYIQ